MQDTCIFSSYSLDLKGQIIAVILLNASRVLRWCMERAQYHKKGDIMSLMGIFFFSSRYAYSVVKIETKYIENNNSEILFNLKNSVFIYFLFYFYYYYYFFFFTFYFLLLNRHIRRFDLVCLSGPGIMFGTRAVS